MITIRAQATEKNGVSGWKESEPQEARRRGSFRGGGAVTRLENECVRRVKLFGLRSMKSSQYLLLWCLLVIWSRPAWGARSEKDKDTEPAFSVAATLVHQEAFDRPHDIELQGDLAFVPGKGGSLAILDVGNPTAPRILWYRHDAQELEEAETVLPIGDRLLLGTHDFLSIDLTNPRQPVFQGKVTDRSRISHINGMARRNRIVFAASKRGWLAAFDISRPANPVLAGAANISKQYRVDSPHDVDLHAQYAVVPDPQGFGRRQRPGKLALLQVFDEETEELLPAEDWKLTGVLASDELAGANRVQVSGAYAFVGASTAGMGGGLIVVDLADPASPQQAAWLPFAPDDHWGPNGLTVAGHVVFLAGGQSVEAVDVSRPQQPVKLGSQRFPEILQNIAPRNPGGGDSAHDLVYRAPCLYVTGQNDYSLIVLRVDCKQIRQLAE